MTYLVDPKVFINDVQYKSETINGVTLTNGRTTVDEQPRAGFANITLVTPDNTYPDIEIDYRVVVQVDNSAGTPVTLWTGWVSDVETSLAAFGGTGSLVQQRLTAVGTLSKLNRRLAGVSGYPQEFEGDRIHDIIYDTAGVTWATFDPTVTWSAVDPLLSWQTVDLLIGEIDRPGDFELTAYAAAEASGLALAQAAAASGLGILYESPDGKINYSDFTSRTDYVSLNGFTDIDAEGILAAGLSSVSRLADLANEVEVTYDGGLIEIDSNPASVALYGLTTARINTLLENQVDAAQRVQYYLDTRAFPRTQLNSITVALHLDQVPDLMRDALLPIKISEPIRITALPDAIYEGTFAGFVEGFTWTINRNELFLILNVSEYGFSQLQMNWLQVPPTLAWQDIEATVEWQEARVVA